MKNRAVVYVRVSSEKQVEGYSLQTQIEGCEKYAQANNLTIVERIEDPGQSGATLNRPGLSRVRKLAANGQVDAVLIYARDRLARELLQDLAVCHELRSAGVTIHDVLRNKVLTGDFSDHIDAIIAEEERRRIRERTVRGRHARVMAGKFPTHAKPPYGYKVKGSGKDRTIEVDEEEAKIVRLIFAWYVFGDGGDRPLTIIQIARKLAELQIPTRFDINGRSKKHGYANWHTETLLQMLKQSAYRGIYYAYRLKVVDGKTVRTKPADWQPVPVPAILDDALWEAAQQQIIRNRTENKRRTLYEYLVRHRVKCKCGYAASSTARSKNKEILENRKYYAYVCNGKKNGNAFNCPYGALSFNARKVDTLVWNWVVSTMLDREAVQRGYQQIMATQETEVQALQRQRTVFEEQFDKHRQEIDNLLVLYRTSKVKLEFLDSHIEPLQNSLERLEAEIAEIDRQLSQLSITDDDLVALMEFANRVRDKLSRFTFEQRRYLIELLDVRVELAVEDDEKVIYVSSRIDSQRLRLEVAEKSDDNSGEYAPPDGNFNLSTVHSSRAAPRHGCRSDRATGR
jgi:site-specific DNA recombinase